MKKRVVSAVLWAYVTWYACNIFGSLAALTLPGAVIGLAVGALVLALPVVRGQAVAPVSAPASSTASAES